MADTDLGNALRAVTGQLDIILADTEIGAHHAQAIRYIRDIVARLGTLETSREELQQLTADRLAAIIPELPNLAPAGARLEDLDRGGGQALIQNWLSQLAQQRDERARAMTTALLEAEVAYQRGLAEAVAAEAGLATAERSATQALNEHQTVALQRSISRHLPAAANCKVKDAKVISGGFSKQTLFVSLSDQDPLPETIVLRVDKAVNVLGGAILEEYAVIKAMFDAGVAVPKPWYLETDTDVLGGPFAVLNRVQGVTIGDPFTVNQPGPKFGLSMAKQLARIHQVPEQAASGSLRGSDLTIVERQLEDLTRCEATWRASGAASAILEASYGWLRRNVQFADGPRGIVHNDFGCHNLLVADGEITAVLDWEMAQVGTAGQDLGCAYSTAVQNMPWEDFLAAYQDNGGTVPHPHSIIYYRIWRDTWLLWTLTQARDAVSGPLRGDLGLNWAIVTATHRLELRLAEMLYDVHAQEIEA